MNFTKALGRISQSPTVEHRKRILKSTVPALAEEYTNNVTEIIKEAQIDNKNLYQDIEELLREGTAMGRSGTGETRLKFQTKMDQLMQAITGVMIKAEDRMGKTREKKRGKRKQRWSPFMVFKQSFIRITKKIIQSATTKKNRKKVTAIIDSLREKQMYHTLEEETIAEPPHQQATWTEWKKYIHCCVF